MVIVIMLRQSISGVEVLVADCAEVLQVKMQLNVPPHLRLVRHRLATGVASVGAWSSLLLAPRYLLVENGIQV